MTLNPLAHIVPIGTLIFPIIAFVTSFGLLGWGRPVQINPVAFTRRLRMKTGHLIVAICGPAMNVLLALLVTLLYAVLVATGLLDPKHPVSDGIYMVIRLNWLLFMFNLLPVPPLDGGAVVAGLLPDRYENVNRFLAQYGLFILIALFFTGMLDYFLIPARLIAQQSWVLVNGLLGYTVTFG